MSKSTTTTTDSDGTKVTVISGDTVHTVVAVTSIANQHDDKVEKVTVVSTIRSK